MIRCRTTQPGREGFTLLEVILALAVLAVSLAIIGEANNSADRNARRAALESDATLIAESVMAELVAGTRPLSAIEAAPWDDGAEQTRWAYDIDPQPPPFDGLVAVRVAAEETEPIGTTPVRIELTRWLVDPSLESAAPSAGSSATGSSADGGAL